MKAPIQIEMEEQERQRLAEFAHDLRTPMCAVSGAAQIALSAQEGADVSEQLQQILLAVRTMDRMLEMLVSAHADGEGSAFTGDMLRRELLAMAGGQAASKGIVLSVDLCALDGSFFADYGALVRVLTNLLGNAVKYTQSGGVVCVRAIRERAAEPGSAKLTFIVSDTGMGMKPAFVRRMYIPFERAKEGAHLPGKGLGLAIARQLVEQMDGTIAVHSEWGKGTAFTVRVPVKQVEARAAHAGFPAYAAPRCAAAQ